MDSFATWVVEEAGTIALQTTSYKIKYCLETNLFGIFWREANIGYGAKLEDAKEEVSHHLNQMQEMGYEV